MDVLAVVHLHNDSGLPEDDTLNDFVITGVPAGNSAALDSVAASIEDFYTADHAGAFTGLYAYMSPVLNTSINQTIEFYDLTGVLGGGAHGSPIQINEFDLGGTSSSGPLPSEVAVCLTLEAVGRGTAAVESGTTRPKQRRTGRLYVGPWGANASATSGGRAVVAAALMDALLAAGEALKDDLVAAGFDWGVWSRADAAIRSVDAVFVDNAFDTQRRRGESAQTRVRRDV